MKAMSNIYRNMIKAAGTVSVLAACSLLSSCENRYNELPPKTDANIQYAIPYPETPSQEEIDEFRQMREEYEQATY